jgi:hypothetical protein
MGGGLLEGRVTRLPEGWERPRFDSSGNIQYRVFLRTCDAALKGLNVALTRPGEVQNSVLDKLLNDRCVSGSERADKRPRICGLEEYRRGISLVQHADFQRGKDLESGQGLPARIRGPCGEENGLTVSQMNSIEPVYRLMRLAKEAEETAGWGTGEWGVFGAARWRRGQYSGSAGALGYSLRPWSRRATHAAPTWVAGLEDWELRAYCSLRYALQGRTTSMVTGSLASVFTLARYFERWREALAGDLRDGTLVRGPAQRLGNRYGVQARWTLKKGDLADGEGFRERIPLSAIWAPLGGNAQAAMAQCEALLGRAVRWFDRGLNIFGLPLMLPLHSSWRGGLLWPGGTVLEFLPAEGGEPLWLDQLTEGRAYRVVMGMVSKELLRVDTGQLIGVAGFVGQLPLCVALGPADQSLSAGGHRLHPAHFAAALQEVPGLASKGFVGTGGEGEPRFRFGIEGVGLANCAGRLEAVLRAQHGGYDASRARGELRALEVDFLPRGTLGRFEDFRLQTGGVFGELSDGQIVDRATMGRLVEGWPS